MRDLPKADYAALQNASVRVGAKGALKRVTDVAVATVAFVFLLPVLIPIALVTRLSDGGPAIFKQRRIGLNGREFLCYKFRSMHVNAQEQLEELLARDPQARAEWAATQKLDNDPRITAFGNFLRKSSLDELPQLINIIRGDMSIVGPRPIVRNEVEKYGDYFTHYASVRPGLTGLWQVSGRSETSYDERVALDVTYVNERTYFKDIQIMVMTVPAVLLSDGAK
jgi:lipopolysaccharide/colanic/teichoic acid biosynthesis glycosyltransferase